jgi:hypothetical protein
MSSLYIPRGRIDRHELVCDSPHHQPLTASSTPMSFSLVIGGAAAKGRRDLPLFEAQH